MATTRRRTAAGPQQSSKPKTAATLIGNLPDPKVIGTDPLQINARLYMQISELLSDLEQPGAGERVTMRERIAAIIAISRIQIAFVALRKEQFHVGSGSTVRKYQAAFTDGTRSRKAIAGPSREPEPAEPNDWFERADILDDDDTD